jgi:dipeptide/tripeptide permease
MQLPYKTKQNQQNNKNKVENDIIVEVIVCHCCRFGCCCFDVVSNQNQQTKTNYLKTIGLNPKKNKQNKTNQQNNIHIHIIVIIYSCLFYWLQNRKKNL